MNGAQGTDADILNNKTTVGLVFAHDGRNDASQAREILKGVTADPQSVTDTLCKYSLGPCLIIPVPNPITPPTPPTNHAPIANAGADQNGSVGTQVTLDGSGSSDPDGDPLTYQWTLTFGQSNPTVGVAQSGATLSDPTAVNPTFTPDEEGIYTATLIVNDGKVDSAPDSVVITVTRLLSTLKKTGQTTVYTQYDDGYYQIGVTPSYTRDAANNIVTDNVTGLMWQDDAAAASTTATWQGAIDSCEALTLGGYTDWRLPTAMELLAIVDNGTYNPAIDPAFLHTTSYNYWSATTYADGTGFAWVVYFYRGSTNGNYKDVSNYVRCVRAGQ